MRVCKPWHTGRLLLLLLVQAQAAKPTTNPKQENGCVASCTALIDRASPRAVFGPVRDLTRAGRRALPTHTKKTDCDRRRPRGCHAARVCTAMHTYCKHAGAQGRPRCCCIRQRHGMLPRCGRASFAMQVPQARRHAHAQSRDNPCSEQQPQRARAVCARPAAAASLACCSHMRERRAATPLSGKSGIRAHQATCMPPPALPPAPLQCAGACGAHRQSIIISMCARARATRGRQPRSRQRSMAPQNQGPPAPPCGQRGRRADKTGARAP